MFYLYGFRGLDQGGSFFVVRQSELFGDLYLRVGGDTPMIFLEGKITGGTAGVFPFSYPRFARAVPSRFTP